MNKTRKILIIGATSAIAQATARLLAQKNHALFLVGRDQQKLETLVADLKVHGAQQVGYQALDLNHFEAHQDMLDQAESYLAGLDTVLIAHGILGDQRQGEQDFNQVELLLRTNLLSVISLLNLLAKRLEPQRYGCIAVISSVAGDRGRQSNYLYATSKAALNVFLQGLRNRLYPNNICVLTIKPGFVDTPMTAAFQKGLLWVQPQTIARGIERAIERRRNSTVYLPWFWWPIMQVIKAIPTPLFNRMKL